MTFSVDMSYINNSKTNKMIQVNSIIAEINLSVNRLFYINLIGTKPKYYNL